MSSSDSCRAKITSRTLGAEHVESPVPSRTDKSDRPRQMDQSRAHKKAGRKRYLGSHNTWDGPSRRYRVEQCGVDPSLSSMYERRIIVE
ncbi:hypothetical protein AJ78_05171 [Emergomyces pasteurianus Ep9510]|uniref:Uncharacterized protein n=1 Tax=Emergomyces pasteurianus Ep9510 TaxID=1447872 RepID=A0A1J9QEC3_9EURO|nr:hypothetical protein AJ78_05171 [Emergomyces pasteurianus Ep9510]